MATISSTGIGSGLDVNSIVTQLVALERKPIEQLQTEAGKLDARLSSFGRIQSSLDALRTASRALTDTSVWQAATATSADTTAVGVSVSGGTPAGSYAVKVNTLAASQLNATSALASSGTTVGQGTLHIEIGRWAADLSGFTPKSGSTAVDIDIGPGEDTLEKIRDKINATSGLGVRASIVNDANGARLVMQSSTTGAENGFRVQVTDDDADDTDNSGLSRLAYDPPGGAAVTTRTQAARNASAEINGLAVESAGNTLSNVVDGVTLSLGKVTTGTVDVTVSRDTASMRKSIDGFVSAYNDLVKLLRDQTKFDATSKTGGPLQGDRTAIALLGQLRLAFSGESSASSAFKRASDLGLSVQTDGTVKVTSTKLDAGFAQLSQLQAFFATSTESAATNGLADRLRRLSDNLLGVDGAVTSRQDGIRKLKTLNSDRQAALEDRVSATEARLRRQYQTLDANMARLNALQNYVSQQVTNWNKA
ncbi:MAG: flagellar filament capping protein FliD [Rubrivivax sp.]